MVSCHLNVYNFALRLKNDRQPHFRSEAVCHNQHGGSAWRPDSGFKSAKAVNIYHRIRLNVSESSNLAVAAGDCVARRQAGNSFWGHIKFGAGQL